MNGFFGIGFMELAFIAILALIVLGPERLPGAARETAKFIGQLRAISSEFTSQFSDELQALDELNPKKLADEFVQDAMKPASKQGANKAKKTPVKPKPAANTQPLAVKKGAAQPAETTSQADTEGTTTEGTTTEEPRTPQSSSDENQILPPAEVDPDTVAVNGSRAVPDDSEDAATASTATNGSNPDGADPDGTDPDGTDPDGADPDGTDPDGAEKPA